MLGHSWILLGGTDQAYIEAGVPLTILRTSFYWDNMIMFGIAGEHLTGAQFAATMSKVPLSAQPLRKLLRPLDPCLADSGRRRAGAGLLFSAR